MVDEAVVAAVRHYIKALLLQGVPVRYAVVFGSQARGNAHRASDIDLIVVSPSFDHARDWPDVTKLWRIAHRIDSRIEPVACGEREYEEDTGRMIIEIARREGIKIALEEET